MKAGFVGLGKLGLPCALAAARFHDVVGTDVSPQAEEILRTRRFPHKELFAQEWLEGTTLRWAPRVRDVVEHAEIVFCAIQTPHDPRYEGVTRVPETRADFDYSFLRAGVAEIAAEAASLKKPIVLAIISTVLPGTIDREIRPVLNEYVSLAYNPFFIAMGTTIRDYLAPEFVLLGVDSEAAADKVVEFYSFLNRGEWLSRPGPVPFKRMSIRSAELTKVTYNTFIGLKIVLANTVMQVAAETGANCDDVMDALKSATDRLISPRYLSPGMGDGGGCHPRDNIAMSWLADRIGLDYDLFGTMMAIREKQTEWLARLAIENARRMECGIVVLGEAFKPESNLTAGSCATLLCNLIAESYPVGQYDPEVNGHDSSRPWDPAIPSVFVLATPHACFSEMPLPEGSVLIDPWGVEDAERRPCVIVVSVGRHHGDT